MVVSLFLFSCSGQRPDNLGIHGDQLAPCPDSPNCVSSDAVDAGHKVAPLVPEVGESTTWRVAVAAVQKLPRARIVTQTDNYLHAECRSRVLGFVDDLELHYRPGQGMISVRSASRLGYSDFGVNRKRVEKLRGLIATQPHGRNLEQ